MSKEINLDQYFSILIFSAFIMTNPVRFELQGQQPNNTP